MPRERLIFTVSQLNAEVSHTLSNSFPSLWVEGEISNFVRAASGHLYMSLKDTGGQVRCAMFRGRAAKLNLTPKNGLKVLVRGKVGLYEPRGEYQFIIDSMEAAGSGELQRQFEELKHKLQQQGWFDTTTKRPLPHFPQCIGVITSPTGAAIRDILQILRRRCPQIPVRIYPVAVQGETSAEQIISGLQQAEQEAHCDVLIVARGGGSIEDLWSFNEENVAQAMHQCQVPIISGVGHEIDFTIADFVADQRAPTPSAAAELVSPDMPALALRVEQLQQRLHSLQQQHLSYQQQQVDKLHQRLLNQRPLYKLQQQAQRVDELNLRLQQLIQRQQQQQQQRLQALQTRLALQTPSQHIQQQQAELEHLQQQLNQAMQQSLQQAQQALSQHVGQLQLLSPLATLQRGYSISRDSTSQQVLRSSTQLHIGQTVQHQLAEGSFESKVTKTLK